MAIEEILSTKHETLNKYKALMTKTFRIWSEATLGFNPLNKQLVLTLLDI